MLFLPGFSDQEVTTVEVPLPLLAAVFGASVKLMLVPEVTVTVSDSFSVALSATVAMLELAGAAAAIPADIKTATTIADKKAKLCKCAFIVYFLTWKRRYKGFAWVVQSWDKSPNLGRRASILNGHQSVEIT